MDLFSGKTDTPISRQMGDTVGTVNPNPLPPLKVNPPSPAPAAAPAGMTDQQKAAYAARAAYLAAKTAQPGRSASILTQAFGSKNSLLNPGN